MSKSKINYRRKILACEHTVGLLMLEDNLTARQKELLRVTFDKLNEILADIGGVKQPDKTGFVEKKLPGRIDERFERSAGGGGTELKRGAHERNQK